MGDPAVAVLQTHAVATDDVNVDDGRILEELLQRPQAEQAGSDSVEHGALVPGRWRRSGSEQVVDVVRHHCRGDPFTLRPARLDGDGRILADALRQLFANHGPESLDDSWVD